MDEQKALEAFLMAQEAERLMAMQPPSQNALQPYGQNMGAIGHPNGALPPGPYSVYNRS
tara:strand:+ start:474 stop:650 length:177 start_codon:yes stop_codon:yes gene_type:complete